MEYVDGIDLSALSKTHGPLPVAMALDYTLQTARGLAFAHSKGIIHRENAFFPSGRIGQETAVDFGKSSGGD